MSTCCTSVCSAQPRLRQHLERGPLDPWRNLARPGFGNERTMRSGEDIFLFFRCGRWGYLGWIRQARSEDLDCVGKRARVAGIVLLPIDTKISKASEQYLGYWLPI